MSNLEDTITKWKKQLAAGGIKDHAVLDELESHLREELEQRVRSGTADAQAFDAAAQQLGQPQALTSEFAKVGETNEAFAAIKNFLLTLAGIPNLSLATNMNSTSPNTNLEPTWATYLKSGIFVMPAVTLWLIVVFFIFPKFNQICHQAGVVIPAVYYFVLSLMHYVILIGLALIGALALLEWRSDGWPRYRRASLSIGVFALNSAVMILITFMVVFAIIAAVNVSNHVK